MNYRKMVLFLILGICVTLLFFKLLPFSIGSDFSNKNLLNAVREGKAEQVENFIEKGADPNWQNKKGFSPLHVAVEKESNSIVGVLLDAGANPNKLAYGSEMFKSIYGYKVTPLHIAVRNENKKTIYLLLKKDADPSLEHQKGKTPIEEAKNTDIAKLLKQGTEYWGKLQRKEQGLLNAIESDSVALARKIIQTGKGFDHTNGLGQTPLHLASQNGQYELVKLLVSKGVDTGVVDSRGNTPAHYAIEKGHLPTAKFLIKKGISVSEKNNDGQSLLYEAVENGHKEFVEWLLKKNMDLDLDHHRSQRRSLFENAVREAHGEIVQLLINQGATPDSGSVQVALFEANEYQIHGGSPEVHLQLARKLINAGAPPIGIQSAIKYDFPDFVEYLLDKGVDPNSSLSYDPESRLIHYAVKLGRLKITKLLIKAGAKIHVKNGHGEEPIDIARTKGHQEIVNFLHENRPDTSGNK